MAINVSPLKTFHCEEKAGWTLFSKYDIFSCIQGDLVCRQGRIINRRSFACARVSEQGLSGWARENSNLFCTLSGTEYLYLEI